MSKSYVQAREFKAFDKDTLQRQNIILRHCDYKELLDDMAKQEIQVDCILTDPPYNISRTHQLGFSNMGRAGMDYGKWDYGFNQTEWIKHCLPFVKDGGSVIIFNDWKNLSYLAEALEANACVIKDLLRWEKLNPMPRNVDARYVVDFECAIGLLKVKSVGYLTSLKIYPTLKLFSKVALCQAAKIDYILHKNI